jgi:predicted nucleotidyltransferase component of viral defense system
LATSAGKLDALQLRILETLAAVEPRFVLSGGAALAGVHLGHRTTRDLDLFWRLRDDLGDLPRVIEHRLESSGLSVTTLQTTPSFVQLRVTDKEFAVVIDLISEPMDAVDTAEAHLVGRSQILVDSPRSILAEKLCALLERSELRDLIDVDALMRSGESLDVAIADAPRRDSGFSPLTLAWLLRDFDVYRLAKADGVNDTDAKHLDAFRQKLIDRLVNPRS